MPRGYTEVTDGPPFNPGFRWSWFDVAIIAVGAYVASGIQGVSGSLPRGAVGLAAFLPVFAFFLFCNVFRVSRPLELAWASAYVGMMVATVRFESLDWRIAISLLLGAMIVVIVIEMRRPSYHGIGWRRINPNLPDWWDERK